MERFLIFLTIDVCESETVRLIIENLQEKINSKKKISENEENSKWQKIKVARITRKNFTDWESIEEIKFSNEENEDKERELDEMKELVENVHNLADSLPVPINYTLDVIWIWNHQEKFLINDYFQLFGALKRLVLWHNSFIHTLDGLNREESLEWAEMLEGEVLSEYFFIENFDPFLTFWRGGVCLNDGGNLGKEMLSGFHLISDESENLSYSFPTLKDPVYLSSTMEIISECDVDSIPNYLLADETFSLEIKSQSGLLQKSKDWLMQFNSQSEIALIIRLHFAPQNAFMKKVINFNFNPTTENWRKMIKKGITSIGIPPLNKNTSQLHFVAVGDSSSSSSRIKCHFVQAPNFIPRQCFELIVGNENKTTNETFDEENCRFWIEQLENLNLYDEKWIYEFLKIANRINVNEIYKKNISGEEINSEFEQHLSALRKKVLSNLFSRKSTATLASSDIKSETRTFLPEYLVDENDWPERAALMQCELEEKHSNLNSSLSSELLPVANHLLNDCNYFLKCFETDGKAKSKRHMSTLIVNNNGEKCPMRPGVSKNDLDSIKWPNVRQCYYPDVYYNRSQSSEKYEINCLQTKRQFVNNETASIHTPDLLIGTQKKKGVEKDEIGCLRRSPRNKERAKRNLFQDEKPMELKTTSGTKMEQKRRKRSKEGEDVPNLSEVHRLKLREAIYKVLQENGIPPKHCLFQVCGSRLFSICRTFVKDVIGKGRTSEQLKKIANAHVKQVIEFEKQLDGFRKKVGTP